jgi:hypothetical protein
MIVDIDEAVELTTLPGKFTAIIPTSTAPINCLLWTTFAMLLRTEVKSPLEHIIICINGPDKRTGSPALQDKKQAFLEELRKLKWWNNHNPKKFRDMPLTVIRVWSRIGHPEAVEMAIPWVHTEGYLLTHDDVIIMKHKWTQELENKFFNDPETIIAYSPMLHCCQCDHATHENQYLLRLPHLLCAFLVCRKKLLYKLGSSWCGYHIKADPFLLKDQVGDVEQFMQYYKDQNLLDAPPQTTGPYHFISMEMGAWHFYNATQQGYKFNQLDPNVLIHLGAMSWESDAGRTRRIAHHRTWLADLEQEILDHPDYGPLYEKYADQ